VLASLFELGAKLFPLLALENGGSVVYLVLLAAKLAATDHARIHENPLEGGRVPLFTLTRADTAALPIGDDPCYRLAVIADSPTGLVE
jgi:hypothetical protein